MKDWKEILRRADLISEMERFKRLREEKALNRKKRPRTNAQIDAEKIRMAEYQMALANKTYNQQLRGQLNSGWINGGGQYQGSGSISGAPAAATYLLDDYPGAAGAWSVSRALTETFYVGSSDTFQAGLCLKANNSLNNWKFVGYDSDGNLDEASIVTFANLGNGTATVVAVYDQSGNGRDLVTIGGSRSHYPEICLGGVIHKVNGKPALYTDIDSAEEDNLANANMATAGVTDVTHFAVHKLQSADTAGIWGVGGGSLRYYFAAKSGDTGSPHNNSGSPLYHKNGTLIASPTRADLWTQFYNDTQTLSTITDISFSAYSNNFNLWTWAGEWHVNCYFQEQILYYTNQDSNITGIESNINGYYSIY
jgi:hypothetical protein